MSTVSSPLAYLEAARHCAGQRDVRYYLNGVHLEFRIGGVYVVATNGHICVGILHKCAVPPELQMTNCTIPSEAVESLLKIAKKEAAVAITRLSKELFQMEAGGASLPFKPIDGRYPDWRRVFFRGNASLSSDGYFRDSASIYVAAPEYVAAMAKVGKALGADKYTPCVIEPNGSAGQRVTFPKAKAEAVGIVMPCATHAPQSGRDDHRRLGPSGPLRASTTSRVKPASSGRRAPGHYRIRKVIGIERALFKHTTGR